MSIRTARLRGGLTQEKLAEKADLSVVFISLVENGRMNISVDALFRIAKALKVPMTELVAKMG